MKLTKGRIHKLMKSHCQTAKACTQGSRKRSASDFTRKSRKPSSILNKTMYRTKRCIEPSVTVGTTK